MNSSNQPKERRRTAEFDARPYKVIDWSITSEGRRYAIVDITNIQQLLEEDREKDAVVSFGENKGELLGIADRLNNRHEQALGMTVTTDEKPSKTTIELNDRALRMVEDIRQAMDASGAKEMGRQIVTHLSKTMGLEIDPKDLEVDPERERYSVVVSAIEMAHEQLKGMGLIK